MANDSDVPPGFQCCTKCALVKPLDQFSPSNKASTGLQQRCKACCAAWQREYRRRCPDAVRESTERCKRTESYREKCRVRARARRLHAGDGIKLYQREWRRRNPGKQAEYQRRWDEKNPERIRASRLAQAYLRRVRRYGRDAVGVATAQAVAGRIEMWGGLCWMCGAPATTIDHVIPIRRGGTHWPANLRPACRSCNARKHEKDWRSFV